MTHPPGTRVTLTATITDHAGDHHIVHIDGGTAGWGPFMHIHNNHIQPARPDCKET